MNDEQARDDAKKIQKYLIAQFGQQIADKILEKLAKRLGLSSFLAFIKLDFPGKKLADITVSVLKIAYFYCYFTLNSNYEWNPYDPNKADDQDAYVEYLLYSWLSGKPGYKYQYAGLFQTN